VSRVPPDGNIFLIDLISNLDLTIKDENDFKNTLEFLDQNGASVLMSWLKMVHHLDHEKSVLLVLPGIEIGVPMLELVVHTKVFGYT